MARLLVATFVVAAVAVSCKPVDNSVDIDASNEPHDIQKRFVSMDLTYGGSVDNGFTKMRTKRSEEEDCERYELCKLHAESGRSFIAAYELYFVNKENARLWDHRARSLAACERRFKHCFQE